MLNRVETTLFSIMSLDGKINTGDIDNRDTEIDYPRMAELNRIINHHLNQHHQLDLTVLVAQELQGVLVVLEHLWEV